MITRMDGGVAWQPLEFAAEVTTADNFKWTDGGTLRMIALPVAAAASSTASRRVLVGSEWAGQGRWANVPRAASGERQANGQALGASKSICYRRLVLLRYAFRRYFGQSGAAATLEICKT